jgi:hypothetical protein
MGIAGHSLATSLGNSQVAVFPKVIDQLRLLTWQDVCIILIYCVLIVLTLLVREERG